MHRPKLIAVILFLIVALLVLLLARNVEDHSSAPEKDPPSSETEISQAFTVPPPSGTRLSPRPASESLDLEPADIIARMHDLKSAIHEQDFSTALAIADQLMAQAPDDTVALVRARVLISMGRKQEAFDALDDILATSEDPEILHQAASRYFIVARDEGLAAEALAAQQARLNAAPDDPAMLAVAAQLYSYAGDKTNELLIREQLQDQQPTDANLAHMLELQRSLGLLDESSVSASALARSSDPDSAAHILLKQAQAENKAERYDLAANTAKQALTLPEISDYMTLRFARELSLSGESTTALKSFEHLAENAESRELRDRAMLEICRIQLKRGEPSREVAARLTRLKQSDVPYVQEQAALLLTHTQ